MEVITILIPFALALGAVFLALFIWATKNGQFDDLDTPSKRILFEEDNNNSERMDV